jgi:hypothetical protein
VVYAAGLTFLTNWFLVTKVFTVILQCICITTTWLTKCKKELEVSSLMLWISKENLLQSRFR